ncbi:MAG: GDYXXLXY domain-containing protein [Hyphomonadaceae bacterium]|nr:MAG: hypothetical protein FD160_3470 [Caulobacteraceae bacterium]MBT9447654.1 GDYXXLXY domain-containing protein [Hyphomonadaceae bacterium]TPW07220.1 MAG: hypothetical protein FD124_1293 [Alphaproteobacteria bacterium]
MTISLAHRLLAAGVVCILALIGLVIIEGRARAAGREVIVRMQPVDPRALLTGHYVQLSFADSLAPGEACPPITEREAQFGAFGARSEDWLALRKDGDVHVLAGSYATKGEALKHGEIVVRGFARCDPPFTPEPGTEGATASPGTVFLDLSVDRFYADQQEAEALEKILHDRDQTDRTAAILSVSDDGTVRTKGVIVDGKRVELTWF